MRKCIRCEENMVENYWISILLNVCSSFLDTIYI